MATTTTARRKGHSSRRADDVAQRLVPRSIFWLGALSLSLIGLLVIGLSYLDGNGALHGLRDVSASGLFVHALSPLEGTVRLPLEPRQSRSNLRKRAGKGRKKPPAKSEDDEESEEDEEQDESEGGDDDDEEQDETDSEEDAVADDDDDDSEEEEPAPPKKPAKGGSKQAAAKKPAEKKQAKGSGKSKSSGDDDDDTEDASEDDDSESEDDDSEDSEEPEEKPAKKAGGKVKAPAKDTAKSGKGSSKTKKPAPSDDQDDESGDDDDSEDNGDESEDAGDEQDGETEDEDSDDKPAKKQGSKPSRTAPSKKPPKVVDPFKGVKLALASIFGISEKVVTTMFNKGPAVGAQIAYCPSALESLQKLGPADKSAISSACASALNDDDANTVAQAAVVVLDVSCFFQGTALGAKKLTQL